MGSQGWCRSLLRPCQAAHHATPRAALTQCSMSTLGASRLFLLGLKALSADRPSVTVWALMQTGTLPPHRPHSGNSHAKEEEHEGDPTPPLWPGEPRPAYRLLGIGECSVWKHCTPLMSGVLADGKHGVKYGSFQFLLLASV